MGCIMKQAPFLPYYQTHFFQLTPIVFFFSFLLFFSFLQHNIIIVLSQVFLFYYIYKLFDQK